MENAKKFFSNALTNGARRVSLTLSIELGSEIGARELPTITDPPLDAGSRVHPHASNTHHRLAVTGVARVLRPPQAVERENAHVVGRDHGGFLARKIERELSDR